MEPYANDQLRGTDHPDVPTQHAVHTSRATTFSTDSGYPRSLVGHTSVWMAAATPRTSVDKSLWVHGHERR